MKASSEPSGEAFIFCQINSDLSIKQLVMSDFALLPNKVDEMMTQLKKLTAKLEKEEIKAPPKKLLNIDEAVEFLVKEGCLISKSTLYKYTSACTIPHSRFGNRLVFNRSELIEWYKEKTKNFSKQ